MDPSLTGGAVGDWCSVNWVAVRSAFFAVLSLPDNLALGAWNVTSLMGKEPDMEQRCQLIIGCLGVGSGSSEECWIDL